MAESLQCPGCSGMMGSHAVGGLEIDVCDACGAAWFGRYQLRKVLDQGPPALDALMGFEPSEPHTARTPSRIVCPHCRIPLHQGPLQGAAGVTVHSCYGCAGIYMDAEDLNKLEALAHQPGAATSPLFSAPVRNTVDNLNEAQWRSDMAAKRAQRLYTAVQIQAGFADIFSGPWRL